MSIRTQRETRSGYPTFGIAEDPTTGFNQASASQLDVMIGGTSLLRFSKPSSDPQLHSIGTHFEIETDTDTKQVKLNSRSYTQASGDTIGFSSTPNQAVTTTGEIFGAQIKPRAASNVSAATVNGIGIDSELKSGTGALSSDLRGLNIYLGATGSGTIGGNIVAIRARVESAINPTGLIAFAHIVNSEGAQGWDGLLVFTEALGTHTMTTASDKSANAKVGTIKVYANGTLYHLQLLAN